MRGRLTDIGVEFVPTGHRLHLELTHGSFLVPRVIRCYPTIISRTHARVITQSARIALQRHLLNMELTEIYLAFRPNQGFALFLN